MLETLCLIALLPLSAPEAALTVTPGFVSARPVWSEGRETEKNLIMGFRAVFDAPEAPPVLLRIAGSTVYRAFINGTFFGYGPARGPHGYYRVDEWELTPHLRSGRNIVAIEVAGYNANSYYHLDQPSFVQAEIVANGEVLAATGSDTAGFEGAILTHRVQKTQRYSFQRPFAEVYRMNPGDDLWQSDPGAAFDVVPCAVTESKSLLARRVPYPLFRTHPALRTLSRGSVQTGQPVRRPWKDRSLTNIGPKLGGYPEDELEIIPSLDMQGIVNAEIVEQDTALAPDAALEIPENGFYVVDFGRNISGFPRLRVQCESPMRLYLTFDETRQELDVNWRRLGCVNILTYDLDAGEYTLEAFEPYTLRFLKIIALKGSCTVSEIGLRDFENPDTERAAFAAPDERLMTLFEAGIATYAQNALDAFMDCPHRERAGWLCDSFFTARSAFVLSSNTDVEDVFLENYLLPDGFAHLPEGMLPMCYPADHNDGVFIPNWALWFVVQLGEYPERGGDPVLVKALEGKVLALFDYFKKFKNSDGLLEKLESWVFIEWSEANRHVQDVNYPSNMLYAAALSTAARLYDRPELEAEAEAIRSTILRQSFDGAFFVDNALRQEDRLEVTTNRTEVCQYFAFYFNLASPESHPELWARLRDEFGPGRRESKAHPDVAFANSFIGNMLRLELLSRYGECKQILDESIDYLLYMAERTGTLWENVDDHASLNHGFASHIVYTLYRDVLGVHQIDPVEQKVRLRFHDVGMPWCRGTIPVGEDAISLEWREEEGKRFYRVSVPDGYTIEVDNQSGRELVVEN